MFRIVGTISSLTLVSRILGFIRDILIANFIGAGFLTDAFIAAFRLPNLFRRIFAEGALSAAFVPIFTDKLHNSKENHSPLVGESKRKSYSEVRLGGGATTSEKTVDPSPKNDAHFSTLPQGEGQNSLKNAKTFAEETFSILIFSLITLTIIAEIFMPYIMKALAVGFDDEKLALATQLARITFPYLTFISIVALFGAVLNSLHRFSAFAAAPILLNATFISSILFLSDYTKTLVHALAYGALIAGVLQFLWMFYNTVRNGIVLKLRPPKITKDIKKLFARMLPVVIGAGVAQINLVVDTVLASTFVGAVSYLHFAERLYQLPLGVIGIAIGTALLPMLSKHISKGEIEEYKNTQNKALEIGMFFALPAMAGLAILAQPIITVLFERGEFTSFHTLNTSPALMVYALGLPAVILTKIFMPAFYANSDTKTPVQIGVFCLILNLILNLILMQYYAHVGLAMATSITSWINAFLMAIVLKKRNLLTVYRKTILKFIRYILAVIVMGIAIYFLHQQMIEYFSKDLIYQAFALTTIIGTGGLLFLALALVKKDII